jgi:hypothetical protein
VVHHVVRRQFQKKKHYKNCIRHLTNEKYPYISLLKPPLLADLQQKVGELVLSITSCHIIIILENVLVYRKNVVVTTLTTSIMSVLFTCMHFWVWEILRRWTACVLITYEVVCECQKFQKCCSKKWWP